MRWKIKIKVNKIFTNFHQGSFTPLYLSERAIFASFYSSTFFICWFVYWKIDFLLSPSKKCECLFFSICFVANRRQSPSRKAINIGEKKRNFCRQRPLKMCKQKKWFCFSEKGNDKKRKKHVSIKMIHVRKNKICFLV